MNGPCKARSDVGGSRRNRHYAVIDPFAREIERHPGSLLHGGLTPWAFRRWFASALWASEDAAGDDTLDFAYEIENIIAERSGDHITDDEMLGALREAVAARRGKVSLAAVV